MAVIMSGTDNRYVTLHLHCKGCGARWDGSLDQLTAEQSAKIRLDQVRLAPCPICVLTGMGADLLDMVRKLADWWPLKGRWVGGGGEDGGEITDAEKEILDKTWGKEWRRHGDTPAGVVATGDNHE